tara:strand:- start:407 stop:1459 length:1053 start_codon:yes stop_codon:yes gene_type:complete
MTQALTPWSVKGIDKETREIARKKSKEAGLPIGTWIEKRILAQTDSSPPDKEPPILQEQNANEPAGFIKQKSIDLRQLDKALDEYDNRLEKELRPIIYGLNELALRLVASEALKSKRKLSSQKPEPMAVPQNELKYEEISNEDPENIENSSSQERPIPEPPSFDLEESEEELFPKPEKKAYVNKEAVSSEKVLGEKQTDLPVTKIRQKSINRWLISILLLIVLGVGLTVTALMFPIHTKSFFSKYSSGVVANIASVSKTVEGAFEQVDHLLTKTLLKFIGLKEDSNPSLKNSNSDAESKKTDLSMASKIQRIEKKERSLDKKAFGQSVSNLNAGNAYQNFDKKKKIMGRI